MRNKILSFLLVLTLALPCVLHAAQMQEPMGAAGYIDWMNMRVVATGLGAAPPKSSIAQARILGTRSAIVDARRNLMEVIKGVRIESVTKVANYIAQDDRIATHVSGIIQGAQVERTTARADGMYTATVTLPLTGALGQTLVTMLGKPVRQKPVTLREMDPKVAQRIESLEAQVVALSQRLAAIQDVLEKQGAVVSELKADSASKRKAMKELQSSMDELAAQNVNQSGQLSKLSGAVAQQAGQIGQVQKQLRSPTRAKRPGVDVPQYTGLVVDARGTGFTPCIKPELIGGGESLYPSLATDPNVAASKGYIRYMNAVPAAQRLPRVGKMPYTVKASGVAPDNAGALMLSDEATGVLKGVLGASGNFLDACNVVIVF